MSKRDLMDRLEEMPSQIPADDDDAWWARIIQDRIDAVKEINRLVKSRNKWAAHYTKAKEQLRLALDARDEWQDLAEHLNAAIKSNG